MRAARWYGRRDVRVVEIPEPKRPPSGWVRLAIEACGICGTDLEEYVAGPVVIPTSPHPLSGRSAPLTLGHEAAGRVIQAGRGAQLKVGTRVAVEGHLFCERCFWCRRGDYALCERLASLGQMADGGLAEEMLAPARMCVPYDDDTLPPEHAALAEPLAVACRAVRRARLEPDATIAVVGAGTIGLLVVQVARLAGASTIVVVEPVAERRELATRLGANIGVAPEEASEALATATGGIGPDVVFAASGATCTARQAVEWVRRGGRAVLLGVSSGELRLNPLQLLLAEKEVVTSLSHTYDVDFTEAVQLLESGRVWVGPLVTDRIGLDDVVRRGFEALLSQPSAHLKVMVVPSLSR